MTAFHYSFLIWMACLVSWSAVWLPALVHLSMSWYRGRNRIFKQLCSREILLYYRYFVPTEVPALPEKEALARQFERAFARVYGRRRYVIPLLLLVVVSGCGFCATARSIQVLQDARVSILAKAAAAGPFRSLPGIALAAFLGAFVWVVTDQLQRLRSGDLTQHDVAVCVLRFLAAIPFGYAFSYFLSPGVGIPVAFLLGTFPTGMLMTAGQRLVNQRLHLGEDESGLRLELESLQSVSRSNAERFLEEGVTTIAVLASSDPVDLALRTNQPFDYIVDCAAQALVWVFFPNQTGTLARYALRTAADVTWLVRRLDGDDANDKRLAQAVVDEVARALQLSPEALRNTMDRIAETPYTRFLVELDTYRADFRAETDRAIKMRSLSSERLVAVKGAAAG